MCGYMEWCRELIRFNILIICTYAVTVEAYVDICKCSYIHVRKYDFLYESIYTGLAKYIFYWCLFMTVQNNINKIYFCNYIR